MSFFRRLTRLFAGEARAAVERLDNPAQSVADAYDEHLLLLHDVRDRLAEVLTAQKKLEMQAAAIARTRDRYRQDAIAALARGDEVLARRAVAREYLANRQSVSLEAEITGIRETFLKIDAVAEDLRVRTEAIRHEKEIVAAKVAAARASITAHSTLGGFSPEMEWIRTLLADARDRTQTLEARAAAIEELVRRDSVGNSHPSASATTKDTGAQAEIDRELAALKATLLGDSARQP
jgi:phage shock protein A